MSAQLQHEPRFTKAEYWKRERETRDKHEYFDGQIYAMAGTTSNHNRISVDVTIALGNQLRDSSCEVFAGDQRLEVEKTTLQTYPDVLVACAPLAYDPDNELTLTDATVIVEVLSRSTATYDRKEKFDNYKNLDSLRHYLLIEQKQMKVVHHFKSNDGQWQSENFAASDDVVALETISCQLELREIYRRINFGAE